MKVLFSVIAFVTMVSAYASASMCEAIDLVTGKPVDIYVNVTWGDHINPDTVSLFPTQDQKAVVTISMNDSSEEYNTIFAGYHGNTRCYSYDTNRAHIPNVAEITFTEKNMQSCGIYDSSSASLTLISGDGQEKSYKLSCY